MDHFKILQRAFKITLNYRMLWVFGLLLALTMGGSGGGGGGGGSPSSFSNPDFENNLPWMDGNWPNNWPSMENIVGTLIAIGVALICVMIILGIISTFVRYVAETSMIRMVDRYEEDGTKLSFRAGWKLGWSRAAWRLFLMDLLIGVVMFIIVLVLLGLAALPLLLWVTKNETIGILGTVAAIGLFLVMLFLIILLSVAVSLWMQFARRANVMEGLGVFASLQRGWEVLRKRLVDSFLMGLLLFGLRLGWQIVLIPVVLVALMVGFVMAIGPAVAAGLLATLLVSPVGWVAGLMIGLLVVLMVAIAVGLCTTALELTFGSTTWTLTYREVLTLSILQNGQSKLIAEPPL
jgi:hypothetical protein